MLDPAIRLIIAVGFTVLLIGAGGHKLTNRIRFGEILEAYKLIPIFLIPASVILLGVLELTLAFAWAVGWNIAWVALMTALLLTLYAVAIIINLIRGRSYIDCGCGFASSTDRLVEGGNIQQLSVTLVVRNGLLVACALLVTLPSTARILGFMDYLGVVTASIAVILLYSSYNQLLTNNNAIKSWRQTNG